MSCVKLHLPWFDQTILSGITSYMKIYEDIKIININDILSKVSNNKKRFNKICQQIFKNYRYKVILLGNFSAYPLPIPDFTKVITTGVKVNVKDAEKYVQYGYKIIDAKHLIDNLSDKICAIWVATFGGMEINNKIYVGDTFHLWYVSKFNKVYKIKREELITKSYGIIEEKDFEKQKLWGPIKYPDLKLKKYKSNYNRVQKANMDYPIQVYKESAQNWYILDGMHRTVQAYQDKIPYLKVQFVTKKQLKESKITDKEIEVLNRKCTKYGVNKKKLNK